MIGWLTLSLEKNSRAVLLDVIELIYISDLRVWFKIDPPPIPNPLDYVCMTDPWLSISLIWTIIYLMLALEIFCSFIQLICLISTKVRGRG